ncbi:MAG: serine/threonine protein kinase [Bryobacterales bacterium]|nr:serine/threonine protein kinase [Bryobacterales bacterium]
MRTRWAAPCDDDKTAQDADLMDWHKVEEIFLQASELKGGARVEYLDSACAGDAPLREEVESLLAYSPPAQTQQAESGTEANTAAQPFHRAVARFSSVLDGDTPTRQRIGPYRIEKTVGHGGMGAVYLAVRDDDSFHKQVAIKVIHGGIDHPYLRYRFLHERQILANLDHPNIARLLDGGATDDGMPYLVMEYVDGEPVTTYCGQRGLSLGERLKLFLQICGAVQHAHRNLVIHRDLKPSNILVTAEGHVKLLDFGIAKLMDESAGPEAMAQTATAMRMLTPEYASPEQVRGSAVSTASDVYSLGVLLFELLTGSKAHEFKDMSPAELDRVVCQTDPRRASEAARTAPNPVFAAFARELAGDLDNIVRKAMQKEADRRYSSVERFAEDLRRHIDGLPVSAREDTLFYRSSKFVRRNRIAVIAGGVVFCSLVAGLAATLWQASEARRQRERAEQRFAGIRDLATKILIDIHDEIEELPGSTKARKFVVESALKHLDLLAKDPGADSSLSHDLARAYYRVAQIQGANQARNLGDTGAAVESLKRAASLMQSLAAEKPDNPEYVRGVALMFAGLADAMGKASRPAAEYQPHIETSHQALLKVRELAAKKADLYPVIYASYNQLSDVEMKLDRRAEFQRRSIEAGEQWYAIQKRPSSRMSLSLGKQRLALTLWALGEYEQARKILEDELAVLAELVNAIAAKGKLNVSQRSTMFFAHVNLARILADEDGPFQDQKGALELLEKAKPWMEDLAKEDPNDRIAPRELGNLNRDLGDVQARIAPTAALAAYERAAAHYDHLAKQNESMYRKGYAGVRAKMAIPLMLLGRPKEGIRLAEESLMILARQDQQNAVVRSATATAHRVLAEVLMETGSGAAAHQHACKVAEIAETADSTQDPKQWGRWTSRSRAYRLLARTAAAMGDQAESSRWRQRNVALWREAAGQPYAAKSHRAHLRIAESGQ